MQQLRHFLLNYGLLSNEEWAELSALGEEVILKNAITFLRVDQRCTQEIFILEGVVRAYLCDELGNEVTIGFYLSGNFIGIHANRTTNGYSLANYQVLAPTVIVKFDSSRLKAFFSRTKMLRSLGQGLKEYEKLRSHNREQVLLSLSARARYLKFQEYYPQLEHSVSHKFIASYLGMTPVSLSRVRNTLRKQNELG